MNRPPILEELLAGPVAVACAWEAVALTTGVVPTISTLCRRYRWPAVFIVGGLAAHLTGRPDGRR